MESHSFLILPGGCALDEGDIGLLYILEKRNEDFSFAIINTSQHAVNFHPLTTKKNTVSLFVISTN